MSQLLSLSRAARLVGVSRGALQKTIKAGRLPTFEGMVRPSDLQRIFPDVQFEDSTVLERVTEIKDKAYAKRLRERVLPDAEVLAARLAEISTELVDARARLEVYRDIFDALKKRLEAAGTQGSAAAEISAGLLRWLTEQLAAQANRGQGAAQTLAVRDSLLRLMSAQVKLLPSNREFFVDGNDSILEAALRGGLALDYGCSDGHCGRCRVRVVSGKVKELRPPGCVLSEAERSAGVVLACCNTAVTDLVVDAAEAAGPADVQRQHLSARVKGLQRAGEDIVLLHLRTPPESRLRFLAGQRATLGLAGGVSMELSIASCPCDERNLHFHIPRRHGDAASEYVFENLAEGTVVEVTGPEGDFVLDSDSPRSLLFVAVDCGFAPIESLIEHAMALDAAEEIHLYWLSRPSCGHYLDNLCRSWADALDNFHYVRIALPESAESAVKEQLATAVASHPLLDELDVYCAGPKTAVDVARQVLLARGLPQGQFFSETVE
jgi:CDP-4-dehydro-6-deoxyglucose reductase